MGVDLVEEGGVVGVVDFEAGAFLLHHEDVLELVEEIQVLNARLVFFLVGHLITEEIGLDDVLKTAVVPKQSQLDDVVTELLPLHCLVAVDIHFLEEVDEGHCEFLLEDGVIAVVVEVLQHDRDEVVDGQSLLLQLELLLDD